MIYQLQHLLTESASRVPERTAVRSTAGRMTYAELERASNQLARVLKDEGARKGDRIGIYLKKSIESVVSIFGILKAGCVYVPIDPLSPVERARYIMQNCGIRTVVSSKEVIEDGLDALTRGAPLDCVVLAGPWDPGKGENAAPVRLIPWARVLAADELARPDDGIVTDLAYLLYTSGSTGVPKGVMISHLAALTFIDWSHDFVSMTYEDVVSSHAPFHFDLSIFDVFATIKAGASVVLVPERAYVFPVMLSKFIAEERISVWYSVPSALIQLVTRGNLEACAFPDLRWVLFAGEVFPVKYLLQLRRVVKARMANLYGPTETNVCTYYEVRDLAPDRSTPLPIGKPITNHDAFAVDEGGICRKPGATGELYVRGPGLMSGYWGDPEKTAKTLFRNPFQEHFEEKVYRTGDLVTLDADGDFLFLGRRDNMIKSRGYRIELGEIETALYAHPGVAEAAVIAIPDDTVSNRIKAFVVATESGACGAQELKSHCHARLPPYMVPDFIEMLDDMPKTSTGKIDKQSLISGDRSAAQ